MENTVYSPLKMRKHEKGVWDARCSKDPNLELRTCDLTISKRMHPALSSCETLQWIFNSEEGAPFKLEDYRCIYVRVE